MTRVSIRCIVGSAALAVLAFAATGDARAASITRTAAVPMGDLAQIGIGILLPQFDPTLGTLTGATLSLTGQLTPGALIEGN